jgi:hypothetical protein
MHTVLNKRRRYHIGAHRKDLHSSPRSWYAREFSLHLLL